MTEPRSPWVDEPAAKVEQAPTPPSPRPKGSHAATRTALWIGPVLAAVGIAWTAIAPSFASDAAVLAGLITCIAATHRFGREGADPEARFEADSL